MRQDMWDQRFMDMALMVKTWSKDPSTKVGAVVASGNRFRSIGYNGPPTGVDDSPHIVRSSKILRTIHAEDNALMFAGSLTVGATLYSTTFPCSNCTAKIIQAEIARIVTMKPTADILERWADSFKEAAAMIKESGLQLHFLS